MAKLIILDVAHGNCALIQDEGLVFIIDCAPGSTLVDTLNALGISDISSVLLSHADEDHIGGVMTLLLQKEVRHVYLNSDSVKRTEVWQDLRSVLALARRSGKTRIHSALTTNESGEFEGKTVSLQIVAPYPEDALGGAGGLNIQGRKQHHNTMSAVIRVMHDSHPVALITGDMDNKTLRRIQEEGGDLTARILVFPHHGGRPGQADAQKFTTELCNAVSPNLVIFSTGRSTKGFPRPDVVRSVMSSSPAAHICCTQLSQECASTTSSSRFQHLTSVPAKGKESGSCCGGSIVVELRGGNTTYDSFVGDHSNFVDTHIATPLCRLNPPNSAPES